MRSRLVPAFTAVLLAAAAGCTLLTDLEGLAGLPAVEDGGSETGIALDGGRDVAAPPADALSPDAIADGSTDGGSTYASVVLGDRPIAYFRLADTSIAVAKNERASGDGFFTGSTVTLGVPGLVGPDEGAAVRLEGKARIVLPTFAGLFLGTAPFSIEAWVAVDATDGPLPTQWILGREDVSSPRFGVSFIVDSSGVALERWVNDASRATGPHPRSGAPSHVVCTFDGSRMEVWVDGTSSGTVTSPQNVPDNTYAVVAGAQSSQASGYFHGVIDELAIYDYALPGSRIVAHFAAGGATTK